MPTACLHGRLTQEYTSILMHLQVDWCVEYRYEPSAHSSYILLSLIQPGLRQEPYCIVHFRVFSYVEFTNWRVTCPFGDCGVRPGNHLLRSHTYSVSFSFHFDEENGERPCEAAYLSELKDGSRGVGEVLVLVSYVLLPWVDAKGANQIIVPVTSGPDVVSIQA
jgi:hypothetical protein